VRAPRGLPPEQLEVLRRAAAGGGGLRRLRRGEWVPLTWAPASAEEAFEVIVRFAPPPWHARTATVSALELRGLVEGAGYRRPRYITEAGRAALAAESGTGSAGVGARAAGAPGDGAS
jgi:hypothetical protein